MVGILATISLLLYLVATVAVHASPQTSSREIRQYAQPPAQQQREFLAICTVVKDSTEDLREWVEHHARLGVSKIYLLDSNSSHPVGRSIADHIAGGLVDFYYSSNLAATTRDAQLYIYDICLAKMGAFHEWMAFLDTDEFLVLQPSAPARTLPEFLAGFAASGGLVVNWRVFGAATARGGALQRHIRCLPEQHAKNRHVRTLVHTALEPALHALSAHSMRFKEGFMAVDESGAAVAEGPVTSTVKTRSIAVHKYPLGEEQWAALDREATEECHAGRQQPVSTADIGM